MSKTLLAPVAVVLALTLAACGGGAPANNTAAPANDAAAPATTTPAPTNTVTP